MEAFFYRLIINMKLILYNLVLISFLISGSRVDTIIINGNKRTKNHIIRRELLHEMHSPLDSLILKEDIDRLYNLNIFSKVDINVIDNTYYVDVVESFSIIPDLVIDYSEISKKWSYGLGIADMNFLGLNQTLYIGGAFIGDKWIALSLDNPWVFGDHISFSTTIFSRNSDNPFYYFNYDEKYFLLETGFYKGLSNKFKFGLSYHETNKNKSTFSDDFYYFLNSKPLDYRYFNILFDYRYDTRDLYKDPLKGVLFGLDLSYSKGLISDNYDITRIGVSLEQFFLLEDNHWEDLVLSYQIAGFFKYPKFSRLPFYEYIYLGGEEYVRGYSSHYDELPPNFNKIIEASNIIYNHIELQSTILERKNYGKIEFGIDRVLFINSGIGSTYFNDFSLDNFLIGYGFGFKFFTIGPPISLMVGFNPFGQYHIHLGT